MVPEDATSTPDVPGLPAVSTVAVSVFPLPTLAFTNMNILDTDCMPSAMMHLWNRGGGRGVPRAWNCTKARVYRV